ncbi:DUF484 family protein [Ferrovum myxofaciens]|jgi:hypothetical protein|uniref:DUF484 family protein n=2 Tax=root TaxID=1 RepID=A0A8F3DXZ3_9PROT|nr:DUF484 family protein [Ferrovum myxofaciens]MBW8029017.1 DUF484 family protein [Ferrovum sp.]KXW57676.1 hypothetical protein FEMY_17930 [Ferrovum myxofaciens]MBU6995111.1 DUF484 family protein [Ferrovum myxofaciens]NDU89236.1 DUF484 family protein [Ferrovum sp.]QKE38901.1 MAG: DUF484 family protein [Ferrovum myxofaciens]
MLDAEIVASWLKDNPEFFILHGAVLNEIQIPHPHRNHTVSLSERQLLTLRDKNRTLEQRLSELIGYAETNDNISGKVHQLAVRLLVQRTLKGVLDTIQHQMLHHFEIPHVALRLWGIQADLLEHPAFQPVAQVQKEAIAHVETPRCGHHTPVQCDQWFGELVAPSLKSFALLPLRDSETFGALLLASPDENRFYPDMGIFYLQRITDLISTSLRAHEHS